MNLRSSRKLTGLVAAGLLLGALAGCGSASSTPTATSATPQKGGTIVYALPVQTNITWYLPIVGSAQDSLYNFQLIYDLYKPLLWIGQHYQIDFKHSIAKKVTWNAAGTVYHVFMSRKWHWSNGQPVTAQDVLFTWKVIQATSAQNAPQPWPYVNAGSGDIPTGVKSFVVNSAHEFTITLDQPANQQWFEYNGLAQFIPMPAAVWNKYPTNITKEIAYLGANGTNPQFDTVVDGPFKLAKAVAKQDWVLVPNPRYDGHKAYVNQFIFQYQGSDTAEFAALKTGAVNFGYVPLAEYGAHQQLTNDRIRPGYGFAYFDVEVNMNAAAPGGMGAVFKQRYVREALQMGIDQQSIAHVIWHGFAAPQYGPIPTDPKTPFLDPQLTKPIYPFGIKAGTQLLEKHGWVMQKGVLTKQGKPLAFQMLYAAGTTNQQTAEVMQSDWAKEGIKVSLKATPFATEIGDMATPSKWQAATDQGIIYGGSYPTGGALFQTGAGLNQEGYTSKTMDHLIALTHRPYATPAQSTQAFFNYEDYVAKELPVIWTPNTATLWANAKTVHNTYKYNVSATGFMLPQYFWVSK